MTTRERLTYLGYKTGDLAADTKAFQKDNKLSADGVVGPITSAFLFPVDTFAGALVRTALRFLGTTETAENKGPLIDQWLKDLGIRTPSPWCLAFVQSMVKYTCRERGIEDLLKPDSAHCLTLWANTKSKKVGRREGKPGDIAIFSWGGGAGHTGIVFRVEGGYYWIIEGNGNAGKSREGDTVLIVKRAASNPKLLGFIRVA